MQVHSNAVRANADAPPSPHGDLKGAFRNGMARLGSAVTIVTTDGPAGRAGFTATAVCSVTDSPPTLLVCLNRDASAHPAVMANKVVCVNVVSGDDEKLCGLFGGKTPAEKRFSAASWSSLETGAPVLNGALVSFDCRISSICDGGTHDILLCDVLRISESKDKRALIYFDRAYHSI
ncbi:FMN reductase [Pararhizobium polonicum]|uniref:FMN reductase n=1 Tax=Pararhizobium polonicum TaxID=1612624 RepID=A0A1C7P494_9HYPH|nr:flavin reductase [Pararhizobium polonicum]OBZ94504.1 FMN reductase [Pararhizobium polonicum]